MVLARGLAGRGMLSVLVLAAAIVGALGAASPAGASICDDPLITGTFTAVSDGVWAKTNDSFHDEATVTSTWTVSTSCTDFSDCTGQVISSQGWSAPTNCQSGLWYVRRHLEHWEPCADGTAAPADELFMFSADLTGAPTFSGEDRTLGTSGACGVNLPLIIRMPFQLTSIG